MMIDPVTDRVYWANFADGLGTTISYANLDGTGDGDLIDDIGASPRHPSRPTTQGPEGTAIDPATGKIYWSDFGQRHLIQYADVDRHRDLGPEHGRRRHPRRPRRRDRPRDERGSTGPTSTPDGIS